MKVKAIKTFATRNQGYTAGLTYEISDVEYKGIANLVEVLDKKSEIKSEVKEEVKVETSTDSKMETVTKPKKGKKK